MGVIINIRGRIGSNYVFLDCPGIVLFVIFIRPGTLCFELVLFQVPFIRRWHQAPPCRSSVQQSVIINACCDP
jgi:hypothetical protein